MMNVNVELSAGCIYIKNKGKIKMDRKLIWWIFAVSRGGKVRAQIVNLLKDTPSTISQLAQKLGITYQGVRYHLAILLENNIVESVGQGSIAIFFLRDEFLKEGWSEFEIIWKKMTKKED